MAFKKRKSTKKTQLGKQPIQPKLGIEPQNQTSNVPPVDGSMPNVNSIKKKKLLTSLIMPGKK